MSEIYQDFLNKKSFLEMLGLDCHIKKESSTEAGTNIQSFKISINEIIIIDDEDESTKSCQKPQMNDKSKLLVKFKSSKVSSKSIDFTKGLRGRSKKLSMLDFSSPLGRMIDFSVGFGKANKHKTSLEYIEIYEKYLCSTDCFIPEEMSQSKCTQKSSKRSIRSNAKYNFRKRPKRVMKDVSIRTECLLMTMKSCSVVLSPIKIIPVNGTHPKITHEDNISRQNCATNVHPVDHTSREKGFETVIENSKESASHSQDEDELLIKGVYSLAAGASKYLPNRLLTLSQNLIRLSVSDDSHPSSEFNSCLHSPLSIATNSPPQQPKNNEFNYEQNHSDRDICREGRNINIIDLCEVENEDCFMVEPGPKCVRSTNGTTCQPLQQVSQYNYVDDVVANKDSSRPSNDVRVLSFLCRICNEVVKCRGFYRADMVKHYSIKHNISNVNLISQNHNGKTIWKVVEEPTSSKDENSLAKSNKRKRDDNPIFELERPKKSIRLETPHVPISIDADSDCLSIIDNSFHNAHNITNDRNISASLFGPNLFSSEVICID